MLDLISSVIFRCIYIIKTIKYSFYIRDISFYLIKNMPYYSQFASPDLVDKILEGDIQAQVDPRWKESGAKTKEEYAIWGHNGCGMACFKMILEKKLGKQLTLTQLGNVCKNYGGYKMNLRAKKEHDLPKYYDGLFYKPFLVFINNEFGLNGNIVAPMVLNEIIKSLSEKKFVIISVHPDIKKPSQTPKGKRGHLVVALGYDWNKKVLYLHNPSGTYDKSQKIGGISFTDFNKFFARRGIVID